MNEVTALTKLVSDANTIVREVNRKLAAGEFIGPQGISGVVVPTNGYYVLEVDSATGDLYCVTDADATLPTFSMDEEGNLYYEIEEA